MKVLGLILRVKGNFCFMYTMVKLQYFAINHDVSSSIFLVLRGHEESQCELKILLAKCLALHYKMKILFLDASVLTVFLYK